MNQSEIINGKLLLALSAALMALAVVGWLYIQQPTPSQGATFPGGEARPATSTQISLARDEADIITATSTNCTARIITTRDSDVHLSFADGMATPTPTSGLVQIASTTVAYDAERYGCGRMSARSVGNALNTSLHLIEMR